MVWGRSSDSVAIMASDAPVPAPRSIPVTNRKRIAMLVSVVVVASFVTVASVSWLLTEKPFDRNGTYRHHYYVRVEANTTEEYTIRLPVPNDASGRMPPYFMQDIEVLMGEPVFALGEYDYGRGIEVHASGYLEFEWTKVWPESWNVRYGNLTMTTGAEGWSEAGPCNSWIFSDRPDIRIFFQYSSIHRYMAGPMFASGGGPTFYINEYPNGTGWQQMPVDYGWMLIN